MAHNLQGKKKVHEPRTLVLCFDGTGNSFSDEITNVVRLFSALEKRKREQQLCYYQPGIGTYVSPTVLWAQMFRRISKLADQGLAWYLSGHIMSGYRFLMATYREGDKICLFGFSRGAYTARCLAGMLHKVGLLPKCNEEQIQFAWDIYKDASPEGQERAERFKRTFSETVDIEFLGVWDTVASVGIFGRHLSFTASNRIVKTFRHALSLDEHRSKFKPNPWHRPAPNRQAAKHDPDKGTGVAEHEEMSGDAIVAKISGKKKHSSYLSDDSEVYDRGCGFAETDVKEVWFAGCHADVGGGSVANNTINSLANPSLAWMINEIIDSGCGILFRRDAFRDILGVDAVVGTRLGTKIIPALVKPSFEIQVDPPSSDSQDPDAPQPSHTRDFAPAPTFTSHFTHSPTTSPLGEPSSPFTSPRAVTIDIPTAEAARAVAKASTPKVNKTQESPVIIKVAPDNVVMDATAEMYDQLSRRRWWWLLEWIPVWEYKQDANNHWHKGFTLNRGRPREIQTVNPLFHYSVSLRQKYFDGGYTPRAKYQGEARFVDWPAGREPV